MVKLSSLRQIPKGIFRVYDIRGEYPRELNEAVISKIGTALSRYFGSGTIVIGRDSRLSSPKLYQALINALRLNKKIKLIKVGLMTTPTLYFLVNHFNARGGLAVTASHNPPKYNGVKMVGRSAERISGKTILSYMKIHEF